MKKKRRRIVGQKLKRAALKPRTEARRRQNVLSWHDSKQTPIVRVAGKRMKIDQVSIENMLWDSRLYHGFSYEMPSIVDTGFRRVKIEYTFRLKQGRERRSKGADR